MGRAFLPKGFLPVKLLFTRELSELEKPSVADGVSTTIESSGSAAKIYGPWVTPSSFAGYVVDYKVWYNMPMKTYNSDKYDDMVTFLRHPMKDNLVMGHGFLIPTISGKIKMRIQIRNAKNQGLDLPSDPWFSSVLVIQENFSPTKQEF